MTVEDEPDTADGVVSEGFTTVGATILGVVTTGVATTVGVVTVEPPPLLLVLPLPLLLLPLLPPVATQELLNNCTVTVVALPPDWVMFKVDCPPDPQLTE